MNLSVLKIYKNDSNLPSKVAVLLITIDIIILFSYLLFVEAESSQFTFLVLIIFFVFTLIWMIVNQKIQDRSEVDDSAYTLKPLGTNLIKKFKFEDTSDQFFSNLNQLLLPVAGNLYETKNIEVSAYIARKYDVKVTLLHIVKHNHNNQKFQQVNTSIFYL